jgi:hypothetical protein
MRRSNALDLEPGVFTKRSPRAIAQSLRRSAEHSKRRKSAPFRSAMSMLVFHLNRGGKGLPQAQRQVLERAKDELRALYGREPAQGAAPKRPGAKRAAPKRAAPKPKEAGHAKKSARAHAPRRPRPRDRETDRSRRPSRG